MPRDRGGPAAKGSDYKTGYGRPPIATQFKKGQSGNPKGRRRTQKTTAEAIHGVLNQKVTVTTKGDKRKMTAEQVMYEKLARKAMEGCRHSTKLLLDLKATNPLPQPPPAKSALSDGPSMASRSPPRGSAREE